MFNCRGLFGLFSLLLFSAASQAQNLVPNPSFEQTDCALLNAIGAFGNFGQLASPWYGDAIYLNRCNDDFFAGVPYNKLLINTAENYQEPYSGDAYAAITVFNSPASDYRTYLSVPLIRALTKGEKYLVRFHVAPYFPAFKGLPYYVNKDVGLKFSQEKIEKNPAVNYDPFLHNSPILKNEKGPLTDTANWTTISRGYTGTGDEQYLTIGNFLSDAQTQAFPMPTFSFPPVWPVSNLMLIDDVVVAPFNPLPDTIFICPDHKPVLDATFFEADVRWNDGSADPKNARYGPGQIWVNAWLDGWQFTDSALVVETVFAQVLPRDTIKCAQSAPLWVSAAMTGAYSWSTGDTSRAIGLREAGDYQLTVANGCGQFFANIALQTVDCSCKIFAPNIFAPSAAADEANSKFRPFVHCQLVGLDSYRLRIFDRYGSMIFETDDENAAWNGLWRGKLCAEGAYAWLLEYAFADPFSHLEIRQQASGNVALFR